jgi:hypothetical protein
VLAHVKANLHCNAVVLTVGAGTDDEAAVAAGDVAVRMLECGWPAPTAAVGAWHEQHQRPTQQQRDRHDAQQAMAHLFRRWDDPEPARLQSDDEQLAHLTDQERRAAEDRAESILAERWPQLLAIADALLQEGELVGERVHQMAAASSRSLTLAPRSAGTLSTRELARELGMSPYVIRKLRHRLPRLAAGGFHPSAAHFYRSRIVGSGYFA